MKVTKYYTTNSLLQRDNFHILSTLSLLFISSLNSDIFKTCLGDDNLLSFYMSFCNTADVSLQISQSPLFRLCLCVAITLFSTAYHCITRAVCVFMASPQKALVFHCDKVVHPIGLHSIMPSSHRVFGQGVVMIMEPLGMARPGPARYKHNIHYKEA